MLLGLCGGRPIRFPRRRSATRASLGQNRAVGMDLSARARAAAIMAPLRTRQPNIHAAHPRPMVDGRAGLNRKLFIVRTPGAETLIYLLETAGAGDFALTVGPYG